jgi:hypothetical protein
MIYIKQPIIALIMLDGRSETMIHAHPITIDDWRSTRMICIKQPIIAARWSGLTVDLIHWFDPAFVLLAADPIYSIVDSSTRVIYQLADLADRSLIHADPIARSPIHADPIALADCWSNYAHDLRTADHRWFSRVTDLIAFIHFCAAHSAFALLAADPIAADCRSYYAWDLPAYRHSW